MVLTVEEKLNKLKEFEHWHSFTPPQQKFLSNMAEGMSAVDAYASAYPDCKALLPQTAQMLCRAGIKKALASIGIDTRKPVVSKTEALELLSKQLRSADDPNKLVKLLTLYAKLAEWEKKSDEETVSLDKLVTAVERKRKSQKEEPETKGLIL